MAMTKAIKTYKVMLMLFFFAMDPGFNVITNAISGPVGNFRANGNFRASGGMVISVTN